MDPMPRYDTALVVKTTDFLFEFLVAPHVMIFYFLEGYWQSTRSYTPKENQTAPPSCDSPL